MKGRNRVYDLRFMRAMFTAAESEALAAGEREPGAEHLVIACLGFQEDSARRVFERLGADPDDFKAAVTAQHSAARPLKGRRGVPADADRRAPDAPPQRPLVMRTAASARDVFPEVVRIVKQDKARLSGAYVLMVAARSEPSVTAEALVAMGLDPGAVVATARDEIAARSS